MNHLFYIMRTEPPRYLQGFNGDGDTWNTGACWTSHQAFAMSIHESLLARCLDGIEGVAGITIHPASMAEQNAALDEWVKQIKQP